MTINMINNHTKRLTITIPSNLYPQIKQINPNVSQFISQAIEEKLYSLQSSPIAPLPAKKILSLLKKSRQNL